MVVSVTTPDIGCMGVSPRHEDGTGLAEPDVLYLACFLDPGQACVIPPSYFILLGRYRYPRICDGSSDASYRLGTRSPDTCCTVRPSMRRGLPRRGRDGLGRRGGELQADLEWRATVVIAVEVRNRVTCFSERSTPGFWSTASAWLRRLPIASIHAWSRVA